MEVEVVPVGDFSNLDAMSLLLCEELQRVRCSLSSCSWIFASPERHLQWSLVIFFCIQKLLENHRPDQPTVRPNGADLKVLGHSMSDPDVLRPDTSTQPIPASSGFHSLVYWLMVFFLNTRMNSSWEKSYLVWLTLSTTSASVSKTVRQVTGPNISSWQHLWSSARPVMIVGGMKYPLGRR